MNAHVNGQSLEGKDDTLNELAQICAGSTSPTFATVHVKLNAARAREQALYEQIRSIAPTLMARGGDMHAQHKAEVRARELHAELDAVKVEIRELRIARVKVIAPTVRAFNRRAAPLIERTANDVLAGVTMIRNAVDEMRQVAQMGAGLRTEKAEATPELWQVLEFSENHPVAHFENVARRMLGQVA